MGHGGALLEGAL